MGAIKDQMRWRKALTETSEKGSKPQQYGRCERWKDSVIRYAEHLNEHPKYQNCKNWQPEIEEEKP
jgi:hypothetical protein